MLARFLVLGIAAFLAGCSALPSTGPLATEVWSQEAPDDQLGGYVVVDIDERVTSIFASLPRNSLKRVFYDRRPPPDLRIGVGDTVLVTIWEAAAGGLFSAAPTSATFAAGARTATLPEQTVPQDGRISIPYAGRVHVAGLRPAQIEAQIVKSLEGKAIEPQAVVTIAKNRSNTVSVTGEVTAGMVVPLDVRGNRVLEVIATAGGIRAPAASYTSFIRLTRGGKTATVPFNALLADPSENIFVHPNDVITVVYDPQTFTAFGAALNNASIPFNATGISLEEAVAKAGGLNAARADAAGVFLLRFEPRDLVALLAPNRPLPSEGSLVPVVYRLDMSHANSYFLARAFEMKNKDILYIAEASSETLNKFLKLILPILSAVRGGTTITSP